MIERITTWLNLVLSVLWRDAPVPDAGLGGAVVVAVVLVSVCIAVAALLLTARPDGTTPHSPHPRRAIDASASVAQSDPDAPGHPRPRAPQRVPVA